MAPQARGQAASAFGDFRHRELATRTGRNYKFLPRFDYKQSTGLFA